MMPELGIDPGSVGMVASGKEVQGDFILDYFPRNISLL